MNEAASHVAWQPSGDRQALLRRARLNRRIRAFFEARGVLEVETPLLGRCTVTDPGLTGFVTRFHLPGQSAGTPLYLQTSPEFAMKRLLAAGSGSIFQICKAFRDEESGRQHNPEFTLLEWYRVGHGLFDLIDEVEALMRHLAEGEAELDAPERFRYRDVCRRYLGLDPVTASLDEFAACADAHGLVGAHALCGETRSIWLDLLFSHLVQPHLGRGRVTSVHHYPAFMPSLAAGCPGDADTVERVEIFLAGMELGNGFHELADAREQRARFERDLDMRRSLGLTVPDIDERLLAALASGLPDCAGIAIGLDRLLMALFGQTAIDEVLAFPVMRA